MKELTVYECEFCKKLFRTPNRHICKFDPKFKNCHSCKYNLGFESVEIGDYHDDSYSELYAKCEIGYGEDWSARDISRADKNMDCNKYEYCGGRWVDYQNKLEDERMKKHQ